MRSLMFTVAVISMFLAGLAQSESEPEKVLHWIGDENTADAVVKPLAAEYLRRHGVRLDIEVKTSTKGIRSVLMGQADLGGTGRYVVEGLPEEMGMELHPVAWDALVAVVHPDNPVGNISLDDLSGIIDGRVNNWSQVGGAEAPIELYLDDDPLAAVDYEILQILFGHLDVDTEHAQLLLGRAAIMQAVAQNPAGIAFTAMQSMPSSALKPLAIDGVAADLGGLKSGDYPLFRTLYFVVPPSHQNQRLIRDFVRFAESAPARSMIRNAGAMPYREAINLVIRRMRIQRQRMAH